MVADSLLMLLDSYAYGAAEELVLNCVCALTNLSFYHRQSNKVHHVYCNSAIPALDRLFGEWCEAALFGACYVFNRQLYPAR